MSDNPAQARIILSHNFDVDARLSELDLTREFLIKCAHAGDIDRRSTPAFGYAGHPEYASGSRTRSAMVEYGGETPGGWQPDTLLGIPTAINTSATVAIHPTAGSSGTGRVDGNPFNKSLKGPHSIQASSAPPTLGPDVDVQPVSFYWLCSHRDDEGLWVELYQPIVGSRGRCVGCFERILLGNVGGPSGGVPTRRTPAQPISPSDIVVPRRSVS